MVDDLPLSEKVHMLSLVLDSGSMNRDTEDIAYLYSSVERLEMSSAWVAKACSRTLELFLCGVNFSFQA